MRIPKASIAAIGSLVALVLGYVFDEAEREEDKKELQKEMQEYIDKKFESLNPDVNDRTITRVD